MAFELNDYGFVRVAVASPELRVADVAFNVERIRDAASSARKQGAQLLLCPELCLTGYTCGDLFLQQSLLGRVEQSLVELASLTTDTLPLVVGAPLMQSGRLFNCAVFLADKAILGVVPKLFLPNTGEFYEERWFSSGSDATADQLQIGDSRVPFGNDLLFVASNQSECVIGLEICEDLWSVNPPSGGLAGAGATLLLNPSASPEILAKEAYRVDLVRQQSARCLAAYAYASAGPGESSTDLVYAGHSLIAENGTLLASTERFRFETQLAMADIDVARLQGERRRNNSFAAARPMSCRSQVFRLPETTTRVVMREVAQRPFVPTRAEERDRRCQEIFAIQTTALAKRLRHTGSRNVVIGISGGLDSTLALLVTVKAFDKLGIDRLGIHAITMPGFGTTKRTRGNAEALAELLGVTLQIIGIDDAVRQHFKDIGHDEATHDVTFENTQARERTQILMDRANQVGGFVVGTGDLSELALGWCTYNADHMSMYGVNSGVPKSLVRYLVDWCAEEEFDGEARRVLHDIGETPVSPELLPPNANGEIEQKTEETVGPYDLHDFFLYHAVRLGFGPRKILLLATQAFGEEYAVDELRRWLRLFYQRFFSQQFKRSCLPDGPKVGSVALSPRGDWRMPSDASVRLWLDELEGIEKS
ncbi:MAG: NAD(+) synthase [Desulfuromonas sp.]|nr:MAG: NAD(+) synthase [Desulfuromonas sp.]